jgi:adenylate kinase
MECIILIAAPAAGKGTVSKYIEKTYNYKHLSTGNLLRDEIKKESEIGLKVKSIIEKGLLVKDDVIEEVLNNKLSRMRSNIIFDGMPRNLNQAKMLDRILEDNNINLKYVIFIDIDKETLLDRISTRLICEGCASTFNKNLVESLICTHCGGNLVSRIDDTEETFLNRYDTFEKETLPLVEYYKDKIVKINNNKTLEDLYSTIDSIIKGDD